VKGAEAETRRQVSDRPFSRPFKLTITQTDRAGFPAEVTVPFTNVRALGCASDIPGDAAATNAIGTVTWNASFARRVRMECSE
jgi:hypothetical protein